MSTKEKEKIIKSTTEELFELLGVKGDLAFVFGEDEVEINLSTDETGIIIGYHGEVLESLQLILSLCISKKIGNFVRVSLEVGDYKKNRMEWLKNLAGQTKERVSQEGKEIALPNLKSWERRVVHMFLQDDKDVVSESVGEGRDRVLVIKPRE